MRVAESVGTCGKVMNLSLCTDSYSEADKLTRSRIMDFVHNDFIVALQTPNGCYLCWWWVNAQLSKTGQIVTEL